MLRLSCGNALPWLLWCCRLDFDPSTVPSQDTVMILSAIRSDWNSRRLLQALFKTFISRTYGPETVSAKLVSLLSSGEAPVQPSLAT